MGLVDMLEKNKKIIKKPILKNIDIEDIIVNELNREEISEIDELKISILSVGLMKPLEVYCLDDGLYKLLGGERRYTALKELVEEKQYDSEIPCLIYKFESKVVERMQILLSNAQRTQTKTADLRKTKEVLELLQLDPSLKEKGVLTRDFVAGFIGCKGRTAQNLINQVTGKSINKEKVNKNLGSDYVALSLSIQRKLDAKVKLSKKSLNIGYIDVQDLNRILTILGLDNVVNE